MSSTAVQTWQPPSTVQAVCAARLRTVHRWQCLAAGLWCVVVAAVCFSLWLRLQLQLWPLTPWQQLGAPVASHGALWAPVDVGGGGGIDTAALVNGDFGLLEGASVTDGVAGVTDGVAGVAGAAAAAGHSDGDGGPRHGGLGTGRRSRFLEKHTRGSGSGSGGIGGGGAADESGIIVGVIVMVWTLVSWVLSLLHGIATAVLALLSPVLVLPGWQLGLFCAASVAAAGSSYLVAEVRRRVFATAVRVLRGVLVPRQAAFLLVQCAASAVAAYAFIQAGAVPDQHATAGGGGGGGGGGGDFSSSAAAGARYVADAAAPASAESVSVSAAAAAAPRAANAFLAPCTSTGAVLSAASVPLCLEARGLLVVLAAGAAGLCAGVWHLLREANVLSFSGLSVGRAARFRQALPRCAALTAAFTGAAMAAWFTVMWLWGAPLFAAVAAAGAWWHRAYTVWHSPLTGAGTGGAGAAADVDGLTVAMQCASLLARIVSLNAATLVASTRLLETVFTEAVDFVDVALGVPPPRAPRVGRSGSGKGRGGSKGGRGIGASGVTAALAGVWGAGFGGGGGGGGRSGDDGLDSGGFRPRPFEYRACAMLLSPPGSLRGAFQHYVFPDSDVVAIGTRSGVGGGRARGGLGAGGGGDLQRGGADSAAAALVHPGGGGVAGARAVWTAAALYDRHSGDDNTMAVGGAEGGGFGGFGGFVDAAGYDGSDMGTYRGAGGANWGGGAGSLYAYGGGLEPPADLREALLAACAVNGVMRGAMGGDEVARWRQRKHAETLAAGMLALAGPTSTTNGRLGTGSRGTSAADVGELFRLSRGTGSNGDSTGSSGRGAGFGARGRVGLAGAADSGRRDRGRRLSDDDNDGAGNGHGNQSVSGTRRRRRSPRLHNLGLFSEGEHSAGAGGSSGGGTSGGGGLITSPAERLVAHWRGRFSAAEVGLYTRTLEVPGAPLPLWAQLARSAAFVDAATAARHNAAARREVFSDPTGSRWQALLWTTTGAIDELALTLQAVGVAGAAPLVAQLQPRWRRKWAVTEVALAESRDVHPLREQARWVNGSATSSVLGPDWRAQGDARVQRDAQRHLFAGALRGGRDYDPSGGGSASGASAGGSVGDGISRGRYGLLSRCARQLKRTPSQLTAALFEDAHVVMHAADALAGFTCAAVDEDRHGVTQHSLGVVLLSLLSCLYAVERYCQSPAFLGARVPPLSLEGHSVVRPQPTAVRATLNRALYAITGTFQRQVLALEPPLPPQYAERVLGFLELRE